MKPLVVGNWKMHKTAEEAASYVSTLAPLVKKSQARVLLAVPHTDLSAAATAARGSSLEIGAQNMHDAPQGAFTGEVSAEMLKGAGATFVLLGHSERRLLFHETDAFISRKVKRALDSRLFPILCVGESEEQRTSGRTFAVLEEQLSACLEGMSGPEVAKVALAYEPVWAIGSGKSASAEMAQEVHHFCRSYVEKKWGQEVARGIYVIYGGSVKAENGAELMAQPDINGLLVGGASLDPRAFAKTIEGL